MVNVFPLPSDVDREGFYSVVAGAIASGEPEPSWIAVDDGNDAWINEVSTRSSSERVRGVLAAASDTSLVAAQRLGLGGAMWVPPSSLGALEAFAAAAEAAMPFPCDASALEILDQRRPLAIVDFNDRPFWRVQIGDAGLTSLLAELAATLEVPAAVVPWPALVVADVDPGDIVSAWEGLATDREWARPSVAVRTPTISAPALPDFIYLTLAKSPVESEGASSVPYQAVHELPHGRRVGWWRPEAGEVTDDEGWVANPIEVAGDRCLWQLEEEGSPGIVAEVVTADEVADADQAVAVRVPGWACRGLRAGSPSGLLVAKTADAAARRSLPLWVPGVDHDALRFVLGLPGTIWVDGPAVPR
jgi:hypothetical protein